MVGLGRLLSEEGSGRGYFMFYVIEKYVDDTFRFAGVTSFLVYLFAKSKKRGRDRL